MTLDSAILASSLIMEIALLIVLMLRRVDRWLPWFCGYIAWTLVSDIANWAVMARFPTLYMQSYLFETFIDCALQFAVLLELAWSLLRCIHAQLDRRNLWLVGSILFLAGMTLWPWAAAGMPEHFISSVRVLIHLQFTIDLLRIVFLLAIAAGSQFLAIGWRNRELYVAAGLGFYSLCSLAVAVIHLRMMVYSHLLDFAASAAYLGVLLYWIVQFSKEPGKRAPL